ncbi:MAG: ATP-dependent Clp protease adaptor ClpS [Fimbriimonadales bacterium]|nr:ATP-dependent Clp protease adaptor ClpS [Fimbriimonadales bacterium]
MPVLEIPESEVVEDIGGSEAREWKVILYNDDFHLFEQVVYQVQKATGYPYQRALAITMEAHTTGRAVVWAGAIEECLRVEAVLREIGLHTDIVA